MPSQALLEAHQAEISDIVALAQSSLVESWNDLPLSDAPTTRTALNGLVTDLTGDYGRMAAGAGADFYVEARHAAGVPGRTVPRLTVPVIAKQIDAGVGWAVGPLFGKADRAAALTRTSGLVQRLTANADRETILNAGRRDTTRVRWFRWASPNCCAFCALMASRVTSGARTKDAVTFRTHSNCRCFPTPVFGGEQPDLPEHYRRFESEYTAAAQAVARANGGKYPLKKVLKQMRVATGRA